MSRGSGDAPPAAHPAGEREKAPAAAPLRVLVAEDNELNAQLLEQLLERRGHRVRLANNGRVALSLAEEGVQLRHVDVQEQQVEDSRRFASVSGRRAATCPSSP